jgi:hypothetical protein
MVSMRTDDAIQPTPDRFVPETEPPVGTVASFHYRFASGVYSTTSYMLHTPGGWSDSPERPARSWAEMTDLEARNAGVQQRNPGSTAVAVSLEVRVHASPPAERSGIRTEGASHTELAAALANLVFVRSA